MSKIANSSLFFDKISFIGLPPEWQKEKKINVSCHLLVSQNICFAEYSLTTVVERFSRIFFVKKSFFD
jgi:hypothetical protein